MTAGNNAALLDKEDRTCPFCKAEIHRDAIRCKHCGQDTNTIKCKACIEDIPAHIEQCPHCNAYQKRYPRIPFRIAFFLFPIPFGFFAFRKHYEIGFKIFASIWLTLALLVLFSSGDNGTSDDNNTNEAANQIDQNDAYVVAGQGAKPKAPTEHFIDLTCQEFSDAFGNSSTLSNVQKDELFAQVKGKRVKWHGEVVEVQSLFGKTLLQVKCSDSSIVADVDVILNSSGRKSASLVNIGSIVHFSGMLNKWGEFSNHVVDDGNIHLQ